MLFRSQQARAAAWEANLPQRGAPTSRFGAQILPSSGLSSLGGEGQGKREPEAAEKYSKPFCDFLTENPTIFHAVKYFEGKLERAGYEKVCASFLQSSRLSP